MTYVKQIRYIMKVKFIHLFVELLCDLLLCMYIYIYTISSALASLTCTKKRALRNALVPFRKYVL